MPVPNSAARQPTGLLHAVVCAAQALRVHPPLFNRIHKGFTSQLRQLSTCVNQKTPRAGSDCDWFSTVPDPATILPKFPVLFLRPSANCSAPSHRSWLEDQDPSGSPNRHPYFSRSSRESPANLSGFGEPFKSLCCTQIHMIYCHCTFSCVQLTSQKVSYFYFAR